MKTKKITKKDWNALERGTKERALRLILGTNFRDFLVEDADIFWEVIEKKIRVVTDGSYKLQVNKTFIN